MSSNNLIKICIFINIVLSSILISSCKNNDDNQNEISLNCEINTTSEDGKMGGCVLVDNENNDIVNFNDTTLSIEINQEYEPFVKQVQTYGVLFVAETEVENDFLIDVAATLQQMFPQENSLDLNKQHQLLNNLLQYKTAISVHYQEYDNDSEQLQIECSTCDIIMYNVDNQVMEVVEHILHHVTDVGLHNTFPDKWGFNTINSEVYIVMKEAINKGFYNISSYSDIYNNADCAIYNRILVQEFSYWLISTYWDIQEPYGLGEYDEWAIRNKQQLQNEFPSAFNLLESTVGQVMRPPSNEIFIKLESYEP